MWWREASALDGFLENLFAHKKRKLRDLGPRYNYRYVLQYFYGETRLVAEAISRKSNALNALNEEYESKPTLYKDEPINALVFYMGTKGGIDGLDKMMVAKYGNKDDADTDEQKQKASNLSSYNTPLILHARRIIQSKIADDLRVAQLGDEAFDFFKHITHAQTLSTKPAIPTDKNDYSLLLVNGDDDTYRIYGMSTDAKEIKSAIVSAYRNQFAALPNSLRCIYETIYTQTVTQNLVKHEQALAHNSKSKNEDGEKIKTNRRLVYRKQTNDFLLSPYDTDNGVVTIAKPKQEVFEMLQTDVFMPVLNRKVIEQRLLIPRDFNLYKAANDIHIPRTTHSNVFSHLIRVDNKCEPSDFIFHDFWPFYGCLSNTHATFPTQLDYDHEHTKTCTFNASVDGLSMKAIANKLSIPWLSNAGNQIKRDYHKLWKISIDATSFNMAYHNVGDTFNAIESVNFAKPLETQEKYSGIFLSQDLGPALNCFANLDVRNVELHGSEHALLVSFETDAAEYKICIPTSTTKLKRSTKAFKQFTATALPSTLSSLDGIDDVTDAHIDALVQQDKQDDYLEIFADYEDYDDEWALNFIEGGTAA